MIVMSFGGKTPKAANSALVADTSYLIGDVEIGQQHYIWPGVVIRGNITPIRIGNNRHIEENSMMKFYSGEKAASLQGKVVGNDQVIFGDERGDADHGQRSRTCLSQATIAWLDLLITEEGQIEKWLKESFGQNSVTCLTSSILSCVLAWADLATHLWLSRYQRPVD